VRRMRHLRGWIGELLKSRARREALAGGCGSGCVDGERGSRSSCRSDSLRAHLLGKPGSDPPSPAPGRRLRLSCRSSWRARGSSGSERSGWRRGPRAGVRHFDKLHVVQKPIRGWWWRGVDGHVIAHADQSTLYPRPVEWPRPEDTISPEAGLQPSRSHRLSGKMTTRWTIGAL